MKIIFLCGSLEPGADGVGDYVRILSAEIISHGYEAAAVALKDYYVSKKEAAVEEIQNSGLRMLRISSCLSASERFSRAKKWIDNFNPEWVSIQFVPYAFNSKGLPFLSLSLKKLIRQRRVHIMFHEIWVGAAGIKLTLLSLLQKFLIKELLHSIQPSVVHTHLPANFHQLQKLGFEPKALPLFSNINGEDNKQTRVESNIFRIGFFSQFENSVSVTSFMDQISEQTVERKMQLEVILLGGNKKKMREFGQVIEQLKNYKNRVRYVGFLSPEKLSEALQTCTLGVTPVPRHALGKSGSVAAFLAHGVPVAAPNVDKNYSSKEIGFFTTELNSSLLLKPEIDQLPVLKIFTVDAKEKIKPSAITQTFLCDLKSGMKESQELKTV